MSEVGDLIGAQRTAAAGVLGPAVDARLEEGAIDDELATALEQIDQADLARRPLERIGRLHFHPRHAPALGGHRVARATLGLFLHQQLLARRFPRLRRHDRRRLHRGLAALASVLG